MRRIESGHGWGISLEVLVDAWGPSASSDLLRLFHSEPPSTELHWEILRSLLRVGEAKAIPSALRMIDEGLARSEYDARRALAAMFHTDPAIAIERCARFMSDRASDGTSHTVMFVANMVKRDPHLMVSVSERCIEIDPARGREIAAVFASELATKWYLDKLGVDKVTDVIEQLRNL